MENDPTAESATTAAERFCLLLLGDSIETVEDIACLLRLLGATRIGDTSAGADLRNFHDELLGLLGSHRQDLSRLDSRRAKNALQSGRPTLAATLDKVFFKIHRSASPLLDDPAASRVCELWLDLLARHGLTPIPVVAFRHPRAECGRVSWCSDLLWLRHTLDAEAATRGRPRLIVPWEDLRTDWRSTLAGLWQLIELPRSECLLAAEVLVDRYLSERVCTTPGAFVGRAADTPEILIWAYESLLALARGEESESQLAQLDRARADFERLLELVRPTLTAHGDESFALPCLSVGQPHRDCQLDPPKDRLELQSAACRAIPRSPEEIARRLFDERWYVRQYPDVGSLAYDPWVHFDRHGWREGRNPHPLFATRYYLAQDPGLEAEYGNPLVHYVAAGAAKGLDPHPLFDSSWYLEQSPSPADALQNPLLHFIEQGARQGRAPHLLFDTAWYLERNSELAASGDNPLVHYLAEGAAQGCEPHPLFDTAWYRKQCPDLPGGANPLLHFLQDGGFRGCDPHPLFHTVWYLSRCNGNIGPGINALVHYLAQGAVCGRDPNPLFDCAWYVAEHPEATASGLDPLIHYVRYGAVRGFDPSPRFDTEWYLAQIPDLNLAAVNPLAHYFECGRTMGLFATAASCSVSLPLPETRRLERPSERVAVFAHIFYPDLAHELLAYLRNIPFDFDLYISTDTRDKSSYIRTVFDRGIARARTIDCRVTPNRARDWGPMLVDFCQEAVAHDIVCRVHSKRSAHFEFGDSWRRYLLDSLLGSAEIVASVAGLFDAQKRLGLVFPDTYPAVSQHHEWGGNWVQTASLLTRLGLCPSLLDAWPLEFPAGSMFWARSAALRPLWQAGFRWEDLPPEPIGEDGTLMHAIERAVSYIAFAQGYSIQRVRAPYQHRARAALATASTTLRDCR